MTAITYSIPGLALMNQLVEQSNPRDDCVFTCSAAVVTALTGTRITGAQIKAQDNNYGPTYTGFASEANLVDTMDRLGVTMTRQTNSTQAGLVALLRAQVAAGHPCLVTMPSQWNSATTVAGYNPRTYNGYSHVGVACGLGAGVIRVMNPWGGFWQDGSDAYWALRLLGGSIWVATKKLVAVAPVAAAPKPVATPATASDTETIATLNAQIVVLQEKISAAKVALG